MCLTWCLIYRGKLTDINITKIGQLGKETATRRLKEALKREKLEAIYGD
jgi:hypothetical protein